jgi:hypothetical protein
MKSSSKDRIKLLLILIVFLLVLTVMGYMIFNPKVTGMTASAKIVKVDNAQQIEFYKEYTKPYAIKVKENNKFYLKYYSYGNNVSYESKFDLTTDQFNKLVEGTDYWFDIKFSKRGDKTKGIIKKIYTENPMRQ